uniref:Uncharacterized protein n=1 Tax=Anguilla anguilla TaxID=7936 RepID=A0A0E9QS03_ANGAN
MCIFLSNYPVPDIFEHPGPRELSRTRAV